MLNIIQKLFTTDLYIKVRKNRFEAKNLSFNEDWQAINAEQPFTTERMLIGTFSVAEPLLTQLITNVTPRSFIRQSLRVVIQDRKSTRLNSSHVRISYAVFCLKK